MNTAVINRTIHNAHPDFEPPSEGSPLCFRPVTQSAMDDIMPFFRLEYGRTTDFSYGGLLMWVDYFKYEYCIHEDTLFIKGLVEDNTSIPAFSLPIGWLKLEKAVGIIIDYCRINGIVPVFSAVPEYALEDFISLRPKEYGLLQYWGDYLYSIESLSTLSGKKMGKKRNHVNRFMTDNPDFTVEDLTAANAIEAMEFMDIYDSEADGVPMEMIESCLTRKMIKYLADGDNWLEGIILKSGDNTVGFSIGDVKGDTLYVHIEKATRTIDGSYETVNKSFATRMLELHPDLKYVNREDDGGDEGLRKSKQSYHPVEILKKYNIVF